MKFERDKVYQTRGGKKVRLICVDSPYKYFPLVGFFVGNDEDVGSLVTFTKTGGFSPDKTESQVDLIAEFKEPRIVYVQFDEDGCPFAVLNSRGTVGEWVKFMEIFE